MKTQHEVLMENPEYRRLFAVEALVTQASEMIAKLMSEQKVSRADLARRLNKSRAWVTQLLSGNANMTVRTLAEVVYALEAEVRVHAQPQRSATSGKGMSASWKPAVFSIERQYMVESPTASESVFRLQTDQMKAAGDEVGPVSFKDSPHSEYAA